MNGWSGNNDFVRKNDEYDDVQKWMMLHDCSPNESETKSHDVLDGDMMDSCALLEKKPLLKWCRNGSMSTLYLICRRRGQLMNED